MYIVGLVYRKGKQYFLAVDRETLATVQDERLVEIRPGVKLTLAREVSVSSLCWRWGVGTDVIDQIAEKWMAPSEAGRLRGDTSRSAYLEVWANKWAQRSKGRSLLPRGAGSRRDRNRAGNVRKGRLARRG